MQSGNLMNLEEVKQLIAAQPSFYSLTEQQLSDIAFLMTVNRYEMGNIVVTEGELVDRVFIIVQGEAEVVHQSEGVFTTADSDEAKNLDYVATLIKGDAIGLGEVGFFSKSGERTATVIAKTELVVLQLTLEDLHKFIDTHPEVGISLQTISDEVKYSQFLKSIAPFSKLSLPRLHQLIQSIKHIRHRKGDIIFHQGDSADYCYLIMEGKVEISIIDNITNEKKVFATLSQGAIFGELAILTDAGRNADAHVLEDVYLLAIHRNDLLKIVEEDSTAVDSFSMLMLERIRPNHKTFIEVHKRTTSDGGIIITLKNPEEGHYFRLSEEGWFIWQQLDGRHTLHNIVMNYFREYKSFAPEAIYNLIMQLVDSGFASMPAFPYEQDNTDFPFWLRALKKIKNILEFEISIKNTDPWLSKVYQNVGWIFFKPLSQVIMGIVILTGIGCFFSFASVAAVTLHHTTNAWLLLLLLLPTLFISIPLHELAHALATKHYQREVRRMGIGWYWVTPIAFADTSDMWLGDRWQRTIVNIAGVYIDFVLAGIFSITGILLSVYPLLSAFFWLFALELYINIFRNMSPILEYDGYFILMDLLDKPNLRESAVEWLVSDLPKIFVNPKEVFNQHIAEITYWIVFMIYLALLVSLVYFIQNQVIANILPTSLGSALSGNYSFILPSLVILLSFITVYAEIRTARS